jgi:hypothetical protein
MRATINFEVDVDRVQETMGAVVREELQPLHQAMDLLEVSKPQDLREGISKALEILGAVATQLEQYRDMMVSFERARFETVLPQPAETANLNVESGDIFNNLDDLRKSLNSMKDFKSFLSTAEIPPREEEDDNPEEG